MSDEQIVKQRTAVSIYELIKSKYPDSVSNWSITSCDTSNNCIVYEDKSEVLNFDAVEDCYYNNLPNDLHAKKIRTADALALSTDSNSLYMVEFKNGKYSQGEISEKMLDSLLLYSDITDENMSQFREKLIFILVYNADKISLRPRGISISPSQKKIENTVSAFANSDPILFKLGKYKGVYFKNIYTYTEEKFRAFMEAQKG